MAGMGLGLSFGAGAQADTLREMLQQKFFEQLQRQKLAQDQQQLQQQGMRDASQQSYQQGMLGLNRQKFEADQTASADAAKAQEAQVGQLKLLMLDPTVPPQIKLAAKFRLLTGASLPAEALKGPAEPKPPQPVMRVNPRTGRMEQIGDAPAGAHFVTEPQPSQAPTIVVQTVDAQGNPVTKVVPKTAGAEYKKPQAGSGVSEEYTQERNTRVLQSVDELDKKISPWTTGAGSLLSVLPATEARNFAAELDTLKANIAFNELAQMRAASKSGGALGQVSDREGILLQSTLGALDAKQSPVNLRAQLQKVKASIQRWNEARVKYGAAPTASSGFKVVEIK